MSPSRSPQRAVASEAAPKQALARALTTAVYTVRRHRHDVRLEPQLLPLEASVRRLSALVPEEARLAVAAVRLDAERAEARATPEAEGTLAADRARFEARLAAELSAVRLAHRLLALRRRFLAIEDRRGA